MKIPISCKICTFGEAIDSEISPVDFSSYETVNDLGVYEIKCPNGHRTVIPIQEEKFEILFEIGFYAIADGYYREAISSFAASLERLYEFYIVVICNRHNIDETELETAWKNVSNQSERQLGAFIFLYLLENKVAPLLLDDKKINSKKTCTSFRNDVIHKGKIPTYDETVIFGKSVSEIISPILNELKIQSRKEMELQQKGLSFIAKEPVGKAIKRSRDKITEKYPDAFKGLMTIPTFLTMTREIKDSFEDYLAKVKIRSKHVRDSPNKFWTIRQDNGSVLIVPVE